MSYTKLVVTSVVVVVVDDDGSLLKHLQKSETFKGKSEIISLRARNSLYSTPASSSSSYIINYLSMLAIKHDLTDVFYFFLLFLFLSFMSV